MRASPSNWLPQAVAGVLLALPCASLAQDVRGDDEAGEKFEFTLSAGASASDNIARTADGESGTIGIASVDLEYEQHSRRIDADVDLNAAYQHYLDGEFDDEVIGGIDASLDVGIVPDRFLWTFSENFGQINSNPFAASTPDNRENINVFSTGPEFHANFGAATELQLRARHVRTDFEVTDLDGTRNEGELALVRQISGKSALSLVAQAGKYEFDNEVLNPEYEQRALLLNYALSGSRTDLSADLGYNAVELDDTSDGVLARLQLTRRISQGSELRFGAGQEFSSAGDVFRIAQSSGGVQQGAANVLGTADPFERRFVSLGYGFQRHRTTLGADIRVSRERYETLTDLDRDLTSYRVFASRQLSAVLVLGLHAGLNEEEFVVLGFDDEETVLGAYLDWQLGRRTALRLRYEHFDRDSSSASSVYTENQASLFILWSPIARR